MRYSQNPFHTSKTISADLQAKNARLLTQAGFIHQEMAGVYTFLPFGIRVLSKIEKIIREEMDKIGIEIFMTSLSPLSIWETTKRLESVDVLMKTVPANALAKAKNDSEYVLNSTHEDMITHLVKKFARSYKDLPRSIYQIQTKFRNEPRAKSGLLRCREFRMKDLYSFHTSEEDLKLFYEKAKESYWQIFRRLGLGDVTLVALASGGDFTPDYSHEFQTICDAGEDILFHVKSKNITFNREVAPSKAPAQDESAEVLKARDNVEGVGIIGVDALASYLQIPVEKTTKTILFENEKGAVIAAAVRGDYDINEEKLQKITNSDKLVLASSHTVKRVTGAEVGYAGLLNLPEEVRIIMDDSLHGRRNFEMGANKTNYHAININFGRDLPEPDAFYDIKIAKDGDSYPETNEVYEVFKACEVGNIFPLNMIFSKAFDYTYTDEHGEQKPVYMGSYGIGPSRVMGVIVEKFSDEKGLVWPENIAPFQIHLIGIRINQPEMKEKADNVYNTLQSAGIDVLYDDREDVMIGEKFADADLIGIPVRLVLSPKTGDKIEWKKRTENNTELLSLEEIIKRFGQ